MKYGEKSNKIREMTETKEKISEPKETEEQSQSDDSGDGIDFDFEQVEKTSDDLLKELIDVQAEKREKKRKQVEAEQDEQIGSSDAKGITDVVMNSVFALVNMVLPRLDVRALSEEEQETLKKDVTEITKNLPKQSRAVKFLKKVSSKAAYLPLLFDLSGIVAARSIEKGSGKDAATAEIEAERYKEAQKGGRNFL